MANENYGVEDEKDFRKAFYHMVDMVHNLFVDYQRRLEKEIKKQMREASSTSMNKGNGGDPPKTLPSSSSSSSSANSSHASSDAHKKNFEKYDMDMTLLKLYIKYNLPMFNGEVNAEKLDDWVRKINVYCRIQKL